MILQKKCNRYLALYGLILIFSFLFPVNFTSANEQSLTISDIEKGLLIGEDAFTDLRFEYVEQWRMPFVEDGSSNVIHRVEGTYARKIPECCDIKRQNFPDSMPMEMSTFLWMDGPVTMAMQPIH